jgi:hypothetical protein
MKRAEAVTIIRSIGRPCRGPHVLTVAAVVALLAAAIDRDRATKVAFLGNDENDPSELPDPLFGEDHEAPWFDEDFEKSLLACKTTHAVKLAVLEAGHGHAASFVDTVARDRGCGVDFNDVLVAGPLDGKPRSTTCKGCGVTVNYTPGYFEIDADDPERLEGDPVPAPAEEQAAE